MNRRLFLGSLLATSGGQLVPWEPERVYSFIRPRVMPCLRIFDATGLLLSESTWSSAYREGNGVTFSSDDPSMDRTGTAAYARIYDNLGDPLPTMRVVLPGEGPGLALSTKAMLTGWGLNVLVHISGSSVNPSRFEFRN